MEAIMATGDIHQQLDAFDARDVEREKRHEEVRGAKLEVLKNGEVPTAPGGTGPMHLLHHDDDMGHVLGG